MARIYLASSWRNPFQPGLVTRLREAGHEVYDFRNPPHGRGGFAWSKIDPNWQQWTAAEYRAALDSPAAEDGYRADKDGMEWADVCVLLLPCGRSAHLEAGFMAGQGKAVFVLTHDGEEPELMAKLLTGICVHELELLEELYAYDDARAACRRAIESCCYFRDDITPAEVGRMLAERWPDMDITTPIAVSIDPRDPGRVNIDVGAPAYGPAATGSDGSK